MIKNQVTRYYMNPFSICCIVHIYYTNNSYIIDSHKIIAPCCKAGIAGLSNWFCPSVCVSFISNSIIIVTTHGSSNGYTTLIFPIKKQDSVDVQCGLVLYRYLGNCYQKLLFQ